MSPISSIVSGASSASTPRTTATPSRPSPALERVGAGGRLSLLVKPVGDACNLACSYCFYRGAGPAGGEVPPRMPESVLAALLAQALRPGGAATVELAWQGGEPLLMGAPFFRRVFELQRRLCPRGVTVVHTIQTNGQLLDEELCELFAAHRCLVGLSIDGPADLHDAYRTTLRGDGSHAAVVRAARRLARAGVDTNALIAGPARNPDHPEAVYRHVVDELGIRHLQILPVAGRPDVDDAFAVDPERLGAFLTGLLRAWEARDVGRVFIQPIEAVAALLAGEDGGLCTAARTCGLNPVVERNGDVFACDHFVARPHRLGNLLETPLLELVLGARQRQFGLAKRDGLPSDCRACALLALCGGGCPKDRPPRTGEAIDRPSILCAGYRRFLTEAIPTLTRLAAGPHPAGAAVHPSSTELRSPR